jgi:hypothetical protein
VGILQQQLLENPTTGIAIGEELLQNTAGGGSKGKGSSGGARVITYVTGKRNRSAFIYDKTDRADLRGRLDELLKNTGLIRAGFAKCFLIVFMTNLAACSAILTVKRHRNMHSSSEIPCWNVSCSSSRSSCSCWGGGEKWAIVKT